jgi:asparagine synthase (glutamine-hydrolysing)
MPEVGLTRDWTERENKFVISCTGQNIDIGSIENPQKSIIENDGFYAFVVDEEEKTIAGVDHIRSIPLFYSVHNNQVYISDSANWIERKIGKQRSQLLEQEFELCGYITGDDTRNPQIKQLLPGEIIEASHGNVQKYNHFSFEYHSNSGNSSLKDSLKRAIDNLLSGIDSQQIVIPLSAGLDSRLITAELKSSGHDNILCFTYGKEQSKHVQVAEKVAKALDVEWIHVPYTKERWQDWYNSAKKEEFFEHENTLSSIPHIEAGPSLDYLESKGLIDDNCIFCPGHSGDMIAGSHIPEALYHAEEELSKDEVINEILDHHFRFSAIPNRFKSQLRDRISSQLDLAKTIDRTTAIEAYESWDFKNRQSKFIINSIRLWEAGGYDWYLPLWDRTFTEFWLSTPLNKRYKQTLYKDFVEQRCSEIGYFQEINEGVTERSFIWNRFKDLVKRTPVSDVAKPLHDVVKKRVIYKTHPLAWYEMIPRHMFNELYIPWGGINPFVIKDVQGLLEIPESD